MLATCMKILPAGCVRLLHEWLHDNDTTNDGTVPTEGHGTETGGCGEREHSPAVDLGGIVLHRLVLDDLLEKTLHCRHFGGCFLCNKPGSGESMLLLRRTGRSNTRHPFVIEPLQAEKVEGREEMVVKGRSGEERGDSGCEECEMAALIYREARPVFSLLIPSLLLPQCNQGPLTALSYLVSNLPSHLTLNATEVLRRYVVCV